MTETLDAARAGAFGERMLGALMHCMTVSLAQDGAGLGTVWGAQKALEMLGEAGFGNVDVKRIDGDPFNNYYVARR